MRANYRLTRLHVTSALAEGAAIAPDDKQTHYLLHVMRVQPGTELLLFNGMDGEWSGVVETVSKRSLVIRITKLTRPQDIAPPVDVLFAPLKIGRLDYLVQKLVEMGAGTIRPVLTDHTQNRAVKADKLQANIIEAAEQCGVLALPVLEEQCSLEKVLEEWNPQKPLIFCDESASGNAPLPILTGIAPGPVGLLVGPEGGFSDAERALLHSQAFVTAIPLGPRILRADTAAVAALALVQAALGDWRQSA